jgi:hypothetical protein
MTREARQVLAELELISHGKCASYNSSGAGESTAVLPQGESRPPHEYWRHQFAAATERELPGLVREARKELEAWRVRQAPVTDTWDESDAILKEGQGHAADVVARRFQRTTTYVRKLRLSEGRESEFGLPIESEPTRAETKAIDRERVSNLASRGCTLRQIKMQTGVPTETVRRWLREAA